MRKKRISTGYRRDHTLATSLSGDQSDRGHYVLTEALCTAVQESARQEPAAFFAFLREQEQHDTLFVQRLLCRGLRAIAVTHPEEGLRFLTADPRRLVLENLDDEHADSINPISALAAHLTHAQIVELERTITAWQSFSRDAEFRAEDRRYLLGCERERRLRLLTAIPEERLSPSTQVLIRTERQAMPAYEARGVCRVQCHTAVSDMSAEQMVKARDEDVLNFLTTMVRRKHERQHMPFQGGDDGGGARLRAVRQCTT